MKLQREILTPQMLEYDSFDDRAETRWMSYLMYFHRAEYKSDAINTDRLGFRISHGTDDSASLGGSVPTGPLSLLSGTSSALGIGATSDSATIASRLWTQYAPSTPWLNVAGRSFSSAQEVMLFLLYRHLMPEISEIVILSGFNNLALARLPESQRGDHGAFFFCGEFFDQMEEAKNRHRKAKLGRRAERKPAAADPAVRDLPQLIESAVELTGRHLDGWRLLAGPTTRISYVLQPLAFWVRDEPAPEEKLLFDELDKISKLGTWQALYGDISTADAHQTYADALRATCDERGVTFLDLNAIVAKEATPRDWLYVDRAHYTDHGNDVVAKLMAEHLALH